jgi:histidinol-phosphate/aromatic aminotransferase/cobyric acid decarboxylase-like protein
MQLARKEVHELDRPAHGGEGWKLKGKEDFSANLNPFGPPKGLEQMLADAASRLDHYPDDGSTLFKKALAARYKVLPGNVIVGQAPASSSACSQKSSWSGGQVLIPVPPSWSTPSLAGS